MPLRITKAELAKQAEALLEALRLMTSDTHRVCPECLSLCDIRDRPDGHCWCDYESDWQE